MAETFKAMKYIELARWTAHGIRGGLVSFGQGGSFESGFLAGFCSTAVSSTINFNPDGFDIRDVMVAAVAGGAASELGGGKFENGAITGAFGKLLNDYIHLIRQTALVPVLLEFHFYKEKEGCFLCFTLDKSVDALSGESLSFKLESGGLFGNDFWWIGDIVAYMHTASFKVEWDINLTDQNSGDILRQFTVKKKKICDREEKKIII